MGGMLFLKFVGRSIYGTRLKTYLGDIRHTNRKLSRYACTYIGCRRLLHDSHLHVHAYNVI